MLKTNFNISFTVPILLYYALLGLCFFTPIFSKSQTIATGKVLDDKTNTPLAYVFISFSSFSAGTDKNGRYIIRLNNNISDSVIFSQISYKSLKISIKKLREDSIVYLSRNISELNPVNITHKRTGKLKWVGNNSKREKSTGLILKNTEVLFNTVYVKDTLFKLESIKIYVNSYFSPLPYFPIRLHFYSRLDRFIPSDSFDFLPRHGKEITFGKTLDFAVTHQKQWVTFDLSQFNIWVHDNQFMIGIESLLPYCEEFTTTKPFERTYNIFIGTNFNLRKPTIQFFKGGTWQCVKDGKPFESFTLTPYYYGINPGNLKIRYQIYVPKNDKP